MRNFLVVLIAVALCGCACNKANPAQSYAAPPCETAPAAAVCAPPAAPVCAPPAAAVCAPAAPRLVPLQIAPVPAGASCAVGATNCPAAYQPPACVQAADRFRAFGNGVNRTLFGCDLPKTPAFTPAPGVHGLQR